MANKLVSVNENLHLPIAVRNQLKADVESDVAESVEAAQTAATEASLASAVAQAARDEAVAHVEVLAAPSDAQVAGYIAGVGGTATKSALDAAYFPVKAPTAMRIIYASPTGGGDGSSAASPVTLTEALARLEEMGTLAGKWRIELAAGNYGAGPFTLTDVRAAERVEIRGPNVAYGTPTAVIDGGSAPGNTFGMVLTGCYAYVSNIKFQNFAPGAATGTGFQAQDFSDVWLDNVHADNCSFVGVYVMGNSKLRLTGGVYTNCQRGVRCYGNVSFSIGYQGSANRTTISNCVYGFEARDLSAGRIDYTDINACNIGMWAYQGARLHPVSCSITNCTEVGVQVSAGAWWYNDPNAPTTFSGNARNTSSGASTSETAWSQFPSEVVLDSTLGSGAAHTGATTETTILSLNSIPPGLMVESGHQLVFKVMGVFAGPGNKTVTIRVNGTSIGSFTSSTESLKHFTITARMIASSGSSQTVLWEAFEDAGARVFAYRYTTAIPFAPSLLAPVTIQGTLTDAAGSIGVAHAMCSYLPASHKW